MNRLPRIAPLLLCLVFFCLAARAQRMQTAAQTLVVLPFENASKAPGLEWIGEAFPEVLGQRISVPALHLIGRDDRLYAFDRLGIPANLRPSRATLFRIAEEMDVDYVVMGHFTFDGRTFTAKAQLLDMHRLRLSPEVAESGPLIKLIEIQTALAWDLMRVLTPNLTTSRNQFVAASAPIRLDAFENYIRGVTDTTPNGKIRHFREAVRLDPAYTLAILRLGKTYNEAHEYGAAAGWLERIPKSDPLAREAQFFLGLACYYLGEFERAENAFSFVASRLPLTEVYNNLGVAAARRGKKTAREYFEKAVQADPKDADYRFNLALALLRSGDAAGAARQLREAVALKPFDNEAKSLLEAVNSGASLKAPEPATGGKSRAAAGARIPLERIKRNYDEASFRQLALEIRNLNELKMAHAPPRVHADFHVERGRELLGQGFVEEAEPEFREAITLDQANAASHAGLAAVLERKNDAAAARSEANTAVRLQPSAAAYLVLARLDLRDNNPEGAGQNVDRALALEPANASAVALKRDIAAKLAQKAQPLPQR